MTSGPRNYKVFPSVTQVYMLFEREINKGQVGSAYTGTRNIQWIRMA